MYSLKVWKGRRGYEWQRSTATSVKNTTLNVNVKRKFDKAEQNIHSLVLRWWFWFRLMTSRLLPFVSYYLFYIFYISLGSLLNTFAVNVSYAKLVTSFQAERSVEDECSVLPPTNEDVGGNVFSRVCVCVHNAGPRTGPWPRPYPTRHVQTCLLWNTDCRQVGG